MRSWLRTEDSLAVVIGFAIVTLSLGVLAGVDLLGWAVTAKVWVDPADILAPASKAFADLPGLASLGLTYLFLLAVLSAGVWVLGEDPKRFAGRFTVLFALAFACWAAGHNAYIAATPEKRAGLGITSSAGLTGEAGYLVALVGGLLIGNLSPKAAAWFGPAARSELYIKTAIVIIGAGLGAKAAEASGVESVLFRGLAAIVEAYLIYWALVYLLARTVFGFSREWAAPLAAGISICGVSAAITTGAAIRARPVVPVMVSSLVVVFSVVEMLILPFFARTFLADEPMVAAAWMGLAVKTDGAAVSSGAITASLVLPDDPEGRDGMILTTTTVKVFIDIFIGVWAILLAVIWATKIDRKPGEASRGVPWADIWARFPKFVFGYVLAFAGFLAVGLMNPDRVGDLKAGTSEGDQVRRLFFVLTFFAIGLSANFRRLWAEGLGKLALVYAVSLFGFVIWIGLVISYLFFGGVQPPTATPGG